MSTVIDTLERAQLRRVPNFDAGDRLRVHFQVIEGTRRRTQVFEGVVIKRQGHGARETFTVRKQSFGVGVERTFPLHSPKIERIEVAARGDVRRAKLYYLRGRVGKRARVRERRNTGPEQVVERELLYGPGSEPETTEAPVEAVEPSASASLPRSSPRRRSRRPRPRRPRPRRRRSRTRSSPPVPPRPASRPLPTRPTAPVSRRTTQAPARPPRPPATSDAPPLVCGLAARTAADRPRRAGSGRRRPGLRGQAVPDPQRLDDPDAEDRPAGARQPLRSAHLLAARRGYRRVPSAEGLRGVRRRRPGPARSRARTAAGVRRRPDQRLLDDVHQASRRAARRPPADRERARDPQRGARDATATSSPAPASRTATSPRRSSSPRGCTT